MYTVIMKIPSKLPSLFVAFCVVLSAAPHAAFALVNARPVIAPAVLPTFSPLSMLAPAQQTGALSLTQSIVSGIAPLSASNISVVAAEPVPVSPAIVNPAMTELTSGGARFAESARTGVSKKKNSQISDSMFTGSVERKDQAKIPVMVSAANDTPGALSAEETRLNGILKGSEIKFSALSTPYNELRILYEESTERVLKSDLLGWHAGRSFHSNEPQDAVNVILIGEEVDKVNDGGPLLGKVLKVASIATGYENTPEALTADAIEVTRTLFSSIGHVVYTVDTSAAYDIPEMPGGKVRYHVEIRKNGNYLILRQELHSSTIYAYFFRDVTPAATKPSIPGPSRLRIHKPK